MPYPDQNRDRVSWAILRAPICPNIARDLVFGSMDHQNPLECPTRRDPKSTLIDTLPIVSKRRIGQFSPIPGLFPHILDLSIPCAAYQSAPAPPMLYFGTAPIWTTDPTPAPRRSRAKSAPSKPLKICSVQNETLNIISLKIFSLNIFSPENMFRITFKNPGAGGRARARAHV